MPVSIPYTIYVHKTGEKLILAKTAHGLTPYDFEFIDATKQTFRDFISTIMTNHISIDGLTEAQYQKLVPEAYQKSDFDWKDRKKFLEFGDWYFAH